VLQHALEQIDVRVLFLVEHVAKQVRDRRRAERADRIDEQRMRPVE
jgi:hypothetical protein